MEQVTKKYDVVIVGGGMVGAAMALGLAQADWKIAVLESASPTDFDQNSPPDLRISAIGYRTVELLKRLGVWHNIETMRVAPYRQLETWEWQASKVEFTAKSLGLPELGYMVENTILQLGIWQHFSDYPNLDVLCPAQLKMMSRVEKGWQIELDNEDVIQATLVIGADGAESRVRQLAGIGITGWQYQQSCMLISIKIAEGQQDTTWQQFHPSGPRAFLPLFDSWASLVWYDSAQRIAQLRKLSPEKLRDEIKQAFPSRLGEFEVMSSASFPLMRRHAQCYVKDGIALIGDAAHTINPLAGQGVNLGYRDVETLLDVLISARKKGEGWQSETVLKRYQLRRYPDNLLMQTGMDAFYYTFSNDIFPVKIARNVGLMAAQRAGKLKNWALKYAIGA